MSTTAEPEFVAETLAWCNEIRAEKGMDPLDRLPKGVRDDGFSCPCGKATGVYVDYGTRGPDKHHNRANRLPGAVADFVRAFDNGNLPQYDETEPS